MFIIALLFLYRLPPETLSILSLEVLNNFKVYVLSGYSLFVLTLACAALYVLALKKRHREQINKQNLLITELKENLQVSTTFTGEAA
ncbi:MAG: hypothetical protein RR605_00860 [Acinetobacter sp.]